MSRSEPGAAAGEKVGALEELARDPSSRKRFLKMMGGGVAASSSFAILLAACGGDDEEAGRPAGDATTQREETETEEGGTTTGEGGGGGDAAGDIEIVNYALTLEYLEADFYRKVAESGLFMGAQLELVKVFGDHEQQHVEALIGTVEQLGGTPAEKPETEFPLEDAESVLDLAATVENLGAAAYLGQAGRIQNKQILAAALSIHSVEARHASALNTLIGKPSTPDGAFAKPASMDDVLPKVKPFIAS